MRKPVWTVPALALTALCAGSVASAQDTAPPPPPPIPKRPPEEPPPPPIPKREDVPEPPSSRGAAELDPSSPEFMGFAFGDVSESLIVGDERMFVAAGGVKQPVRVHVPGLDVRCENIVLWGDRDKLEASVSKHRESVLGKGAEEILGPVLHALYAEGGVVMQRGNQLIRADRLFIDFQRGKAYFVHAQMSQHLDRARQRALPLTVRADVIRETAKDKFTAENAQITTCSYADPHFEFDAKEIEVDYSKTDTSFSTSWWPTVRMNTAVAEKTPFFTFPVIGGSTGSTSIFPVQGFGFSHGSREGTSARVTWGGAIRNGDGSKWGDWKLHTDERTLRGPGLGFDIDHRGPRRTDGVPQDELSFSGYWQRDGRGFDTYSDRGYDGQIDRSVTDRNRGQAHFFDRWNLDDDSVFGKGWRLTSEVSYHSDRGYIPEFHPDDAESTKQQETYVEARKTWGNQGVSILGSYRLNDETSALNRAPGDILLTDYENQTQYLPSATYHLVSQPVFNGKDGPFPVNLSVQADVANVKRRYDDHLAARIEDDNGWRAEYVRRGDLETRVTTPFSLGDIHFNPAFGGSLMGVDDANGFRRQDDGSQGRYSAFYGIRAGTQAWKAYPESRSSFLDLDGIRHVVSLDAQYFDRFKVSDDPFTFQSNDLVDELAEDRIGSVRLRNRLQTKRDGEVVDWLDWEARFLYYFEPSPSVVGSPFGLREDFPEPLQRIDFPGQDKYDAIRRDGSAFMQHRARLQLTKALWLVGETDYDFDRDFLETSEAGLRWFLHDRLSVYVGRRTIHGDSTIFTTRMDYRLSNRWGVEIEHQQDTKSDKGLRTILALFRRAHDYTIAVELRSDKQTDDRSVSFAIYPNDWLSSSDDPFSLRRPLDYAALKWYR